MITTLASTTHKAVKTVYYPASKLPKPFRDFPIASTLKLSQSNGYMTVTSLTWDDEKQELAGRRETIPARVEQEFETCVPARAFRDWLAASQLTKEEKAKGQHEQVNFTYDPAVCLLTVKQGNSRATFKCLDAREFPHSALQ